MATGSGTISSINRIGFRTANMDGSTAQDRYYVDAISLLAQLPVSTTAAQQAGQVPVPGTAVLAGLGLVLMLLTPGSRHRARCTANRP